MNNNMYTAQFPYYSPYGGAIQNRQDIPSYLPPQPIAPALIKGRPVTSLEEARVAQIDLDGSIFIFPDYGNKKIYTKKINADGTASLSSYCLEEPTAEEEQKYITKKEFIEFQKELQRLLKPAAAAEEKPDMGKSKINF